MAWWSHGFAVVVVAVTVVLVVAVVVEVLHRKSLSFWAAILALRASRYFFFSAYLAATWPAVAVICLMALLRASALARYTACGSHGFAVVHPASLSFWAATLARRSARCCFLASYWKAMAVVLLVICLMAEASTSAFVW